MSFICRLEKQVSMREIIHVLVVKFLSIRTITIARGERLHNFKDAGSRCGVIRDGDFTQNQIKIPPIVFSQLRQLFDSTFDCGHGDGRCSCSNILQQCRDLVERAVRNTAVPVTSL